MSVIEIKVKTDVPLSEWPDSMWNNKCPVCHKHTEDKHWVGSFGFHEAGNPWIPRSHYRCRIRRMPKDLFWILITLITFWWRTND